MLLEAAQQGSLAEVLIVASALSVQDVRERPADRQQAADQAHAQWKDPDSDFAALINLWRGFEEQRQALAPCAAQLVPKEFPQLSASSRVARCPSPADADRPRTQARCPGGQSRPRSPPEGRTPWQRSRPRKDRSSAIGRGPRTDQGQQGQRHRPPAGRSQRGRAEGQELCRGAQGHPRRPAQPDRQQDRGG